MLIFCPYCGTNYAQAPATQPSVKNIAPVIYDRPIDQNNGPVPEPPKLVYQPQYPPYEGVPVGLLDGKNLRLAFILALIPGFLGFMGLGHLYMGKWLKGVVLFFLGGFLAMLSMVSIMMLFEPSEFEIGVRVFTAAFMSAPYLILQLWQAFDAPKPNNRMPRYPY